MEWRPRGAFAPQRTEIRNQVRQASLVGGDEECKDSETSLGTPR